MELPIRKFECLKCKFSDFRMSAREVGEVVPSECPKCGGGMMVLKEKPPIWLAEPLASLSKHFDVVDFIGREGRVQAEVESQDPKHSFQSLFHELKERRYIPMMRKKDGALWIMVMEAPLRKPENVRVNILLLLATILTTFLAGYFFLFGEVSQAALFSFSIMLVLGVHEMGHRMVARRSGVDTTLPYFIPFPFFLGTLGAVINVKDPIPDKDTLVKVGVAGPLVGFAVAVLIVFLGMMVFPPAEKSIAFSSPLIILIIQLAVGRAPVGFEPNPLMVAGGVSLLLTSFNLLPAGQLDGGHVARGFLGQERHYTLSRLLGYVLALTFFIFPYLPLWFWGFIIILAFGVPHPGALDDVSGISRRQKLLAGITFIILILCFPVPLP